MKEIVNNGNIFLLPRPKEREAVCVTTNGIICNNGKAVMGRGIAKYVRDTFNGVDFLLGTKIKHYGNHAFNLGIYEKPDGNEKIPFMLLSFPTKDHWKDKSKPRLIRQSCREVMDLAEMYGLESIYLPCPGCANGQLDYWNDVRPILLEELDARFVVAIPDQIYKNKERDENELQKAQYRKFHE